MKLCNVLYSNLLLCSVSAMTETHGNGAMVEFNLPVWSETSYSKVYV